MKKTQGDGGLTIKYAALQGNYWMLFGSVFTFIAVFLLSRGFSAGGVGVLMALGNITGAVLQPWIAAVADKSEKYTLKQMMMCITVLGIIPAAALALVPGSRYLAAGLLMVVMAVVSVQQPLVNAVNGYYLSRGKSMNFGIARGTGSLGFAVLSWIMGYFVASFGENVIPIAICFLLVTMLAVLSSFRMERGRESGAEKDKNAKKPSEISSKGDVISRTQGSGWGLIRKYRKFFLVLAGIVFLFAFHNMVNTYLIQIMERFGGDSSDMGTSIAIAAVCEIPVMVMFSKIAERIRPNRLLKIAGLGFLLKAAAIWMAGSVLLVHASQLLQALSFAILIPASVYYSDEVMEEQDRVKGQAFITAAITVGGMVGNLFGGKIIDAAGVPAMLTIGVACAGAGMLFVWIGAVPAKERGSDGAL